MADFKGVIVGSGFVDEKDQVIMHILGMGSTGMSPDFARKIADDLLRNANYIDPLPEETNDE